MKLALGIMAVMVVGIAVLIAVAVRSTNDDTPDHLTACLKDTDAVVVRGSDGLAGLRRDLVLQTPPKVQRLQVGDDPGALLSGTGYRVLVLTGRKSPSLAGDLPDRVYHRADAYAVVAVEPEASQGMVGCARTVR